MDLLKRIDPGVAARPSRPHPPGTLLTRQEPCSPAGSPPGIGAAAVVPAQRPPDAPLGHGGRRGHHGPRIALAPGQQLAVSHVAFLFSDLKGSTRLYEGLGDASAYSRVSRHFDFIRQAVSRGGGGIVKTMGDGVMCAFYRLDDALGAAIRLQQEVTAWCREQDIEPPLVLKVGVHHGPAIAMTANDNLDYFGRTGQPRGPGRGPEPRRRRGRAARRARPGRPVTQGSGITAEPFTTRLRGLDEDQHLVRLTCA